MIAKIIMWAEALLDYLSEMWKYTCDDENCCRR